MSYYTYLPVKPPIIEDDEVNHKFARKIHNTFVTLEDVWCMCVWNDYLACGLASGEIRMYDIETGEHIQTLTAHKGIICQLILWGTNLVSASNDGELRIWNASSTTSQLFEVRKEPDMPAYPFFICVVNTHFLWAHASNSGTILILNDTQLPITRKNIKEKQNITAMNSVDAYVFTGVDFLYVRKWSCDGIPLSSFSVGYSFLDILNWNGRIACTARNNPIHIYSAQSLKLRHSIACPSFLKKFSLVECNNVLAVIGTKPPCIHLYSNSMVEIDSINASCEVLCSWRDRLFVFSGQHIAVWKVKRPSWSSIRLLWIAFFKNQQLTECRIARLPKDMIRLIAKFVEEV